MKILFVIDMQKGFILNRSYIKLVDKINYLLNNSQYDKVIFTKFINNKKKNGLFIKYLNYNKMNFKNEQDICVDIPNNSIILEKYGYSLNNEDIDYIKSLKVSEVDICGIMADACVYAIALQLFDNSIYPNILINYVECNKRLKKSLEQIFINQFGKVDKRK